MPDIGVVALDDHLPGARQFQTPYVLKPFIGWLSCCHNTSLCGLGRSRMSPHQRIDHTLIVDARVVRDPYRHDPW
jgi:hypothetical protein